MGEVTLRPTAAEAAAAYRAMVLANREVVEAIEGQRPPGTDYWATRAPQFRPGRMTVPELEPLGRLLEPEDTLLDIGAGGGRFAVPLAARVRRVVAVEPSPSMREQLAGATAEAGAGNIDIVDLEWPPERRDERLTADVSLAANVLYAIADVEGFLAAMEAHTRRTCTVVAFDRAPNTPIPEIWRELWGVEFRELPALRELVAVLYARGRRVRVEPVPQPAAAPRPVDEVAADFAWMYHVRPGLPDYEAKLERFRELVTRACGTGDGLARAPVVRRYSAVVSWSPGD